MIPRYFQHLTDAIKTNANGAFDLCKETKDIEKAQILENLFTKYGEDAAELIKVIALQENQEPNGEPCRPFTRAPCEESSGNRVVFNVDAPCFIPHCSTDNNILYHRGCPSQWDNEDRHTWPAPHFIHAQYPQHHYHFSPQHSSQSLLFTGNPLHVYSHYPGPHLSLWSQSGTSGDHNPRRAHRHRYHRKHDSSKKVLNNKDIVDSTHANDTVPLPEKNKNDVGNNFDQKLAESVKDSVVSDFRNPTINEEDSLKETVDESMLSTSEQLIDFPELTNLLPVKKRKSRFPPFKNQRKVKLSLNDLQKRFGSSEVEDKRLSKTSATRSLASHTLYGEKVPMRAISEVPCPCIEKVYRRSQTLFEKVPEEILDEADGWKKVKPRFNKNRSNIKQISLEENLLGVHPCKVCQSTYKRRYQASNRKHVNVNVRRNSHFSSNKYGSPRNNCSREAIPSHVVGLHFNNVLVPSHVTRKCGKLNNEVSSTVSKNDHVTFADSEQVSNSPNKISGQVLNLVSKNHTPASSYVDSNNTGELSNEYQDLATGVNDYTVVKSNLLFSPFLDDDLSLQNNIPTLSTAASTGSTVNNEDDCNVDSNNMDLSGDMSIDDDNPMNDSMPVVEDAHAMHGEFMKYLNCSTWPTQMDEIDKFESMIAGNNPSDPVLMYPSVSVEQFTEFIQRHPDEAHAFRREITLKLKKIRETETKQQQAYEKRLELLKSKTAKVRGFVQKVKDVQLAQDKLALKRKHQIDEKLRKAEENRKNYLSIIRRKAHDEEEKLKEIAFINELEAQNRRHDSLALRQGQEDRLLAINEERQRRFDEKAAKEAAAEERRRVLEAERIEKLQKMAEARRRKEEFIDKKNQEREKERLENAREKQREREERLLARCALQRATAEELQKRIQQKQEDSARRHEETLELIRQRALEVGLHRSTEDTTSISPINRMEEPVTMDVEFIQDTSETVKIKQSRKKRLRKIKLRLVSRGSDFLTNYPTCNSSECNFERDIEGLNCGLSVDASLTIINNIKSRLKAEECLYEKFAQCRGLVPISSLLKNYLIKSSYTFSAQDYLLMEAILDLLKRFVVQGGDTCRRYFILSNDLMVILDFLKFSLGGPKKMDRLIKLFGSGLELLTQCLDPILIKSGDISSSQIADVCSYLLNSGIMEGMIALIKSEAINEGNQTMIILPTSIKFFGALVNPSLKCTELTNLTLSSECFGTVSIMYEALQKLTITEELPPFILPIIKFLEHFACVDVIAFQNALGDDSMALQTRAIASNLLSYSKAKPNNELLHIIISLVGYFAMKNAKNQTLLQSGQQPTVLQQLVNLPLIYFCEEKYTELLFPTLYVCSHNNPTNRAIVENDMNFLQLENYIFSPKGEESPLMKKFQQLKDR